MNRTLTLFPWDAATGTYGAAQTKSLAAWGIADEISGGFASQNADRLALEFPAGALAAAQPFTYRSRVQFTFDGKLFFTGYVTDDIREFSGSKNNGKLQVSGPWWYLENLIFEQTIQILTGYDDTHTAQFTPQYFTHFTLNLSRQANTSIGLIYEVAYQNSQDLIASVLDWAMAKGAYLQYTKAELMNIPVLPRDVMNITCADAIRRQMEDVDAVCWFDHTVDPPKFNCKQRKDLPKITRALGNAAQAQGFNLKRRYDLAVPYVRICFEAINTFNGVQGINQVFDTYPDPPPDDMLKALITTVPLRGYNASSVTKWIKTATIDGQSVDFWKQRKPEMDTAVNPNAPLEYNGLALTPNSFQRQSENAYPRMIVEGGHASWMGGNAEDDILTVQATYERKVTAAPATPAPPAVSLPGKKISQHTLSCRIVATDLDYPDGKEIPTTSVSSQGEDPNAFVGLAKTIYDDLNAPAWDGTIPLFEGVYIGDIVLGLNYNLTGGLPEYITMNALAQNIDFTSKGGGLFYNISVGTNKKLSPGQLADRLRAKRVAYVTSLYFNPAPSSGQVALPKSERRDTVSNAEPQKTQDHVFDNLGGILMQGNNGQPVLTLQRYDAAGNALTPASATPSGQIILDYAKTLGSDGKYHTVQLQEQKICELVNGVKKQRTVLVPTSESFRAPDDPA